MADLNLKPIELTQHVKEIINSPDARKVLATVGKDGIPHVTFKGSFHVTEDGLLEFYEFIESSQTNKNLVYSLWFDKTVAVNVYLEGESFLIKGKVDRALVAGREFEKHYNLIQEKKKIDLSTVWKIIPTEIKEESFEKRRKEEAENHPILRHLDMLTK